MATATDTPSTVGQPGTATPGFVRRNRGKLVAFGVIVVLVGGLALYTMATLAFTYSRGERVGYVQKLSKKGWVCPTWEGELAMSPMPGVPPQIFAFTIPEEAVAQKVRQAEGKRVVLQYEEKKGVPSTCFGETDYFVTDARVVAGP